MKRQTAGEAWRFGVMLRWVAVMIVALGLAMALPAGYANNESDLLETEAELKDSILQLQTIADGWPPRIDTPEERAAAERLWNLIEQSLLQMRAGDPDDYYFALWLGDCYRMGHNLDIDGASTKAVSHLRAASRLSPEAFFPHLILGDHYTFSGRPDEGELEYLKAIRLSDEPLPRAYYGLANAYYFQEEFGAAVEYAGQYLDHDPSNEAMMLVRERAAAALEGLFEPKTIEIIDNEKPDGVVVVGGTFEPPHSATQEGSTPNIKPDEQLKILAGYPDIKPGVELTKVAGFVWRGQHLLEEYREDYIRVNLSWNGEVHLPYAVEYSFKDNKLVQYEFEKREKPPDFEGEKRKGFDAMPWVVIDRSLLGYSFEVSPAWRLLHESNMKGNGFDFRFTVLGLPTVYDPDLDSWIENSVQWCVFTRKKGYAKIENVVKSEESRLRMMGSKIVKRTEKTGDHPAYVYEIEYGGNPYLGKTYFFVYDGKGYAVRFNATKYTYSVNLPKFERFIKGFRLSHERSEDPDMELIEIDGAIMSIVGGAFTAEDVKGLDKETYRYRDHRE
jgi:tetratricopeptide (TPR) repeat protein